MVGRPDCSTWSRAEARRRSPNGSPSARSRSARRWRRSRWMRSRATRRPPHVRCRMPWRSSTRSTSSSSPATRSRPCAAGSNARPPAGAAPGPIRSIGAGGSCSRPPVSGPTDRRNAPTSCLATRPTSRSPSRTASTRRSSPVFRQVGVSCLVMYFFRV